MLLLSLECVVLEYETLLGNLTGKRPPRWHYLHKETFLKIILGKDLEGTGI